MTTPSRAALPASKQAKKGAAKGRRAVSKAAGSQKIKKASQSATNVAIATELAPAVTIALLDKTQQAEGDPAPALECLAAGAVPSETKGKVRVQLMFENGAVLPVEMSVAAGAALSKGLSQELPKK